MPDAQSPRSIPTMGTPSTNATSAPGDTPVAPAKDEVPPATEPASTEFVTAAPASAAATSVTPLDVPLITGTTTYYEAAARIEGVLAGSTADGGCLWLEEGTGSGTGTVSVVWPEGSKVRLPELSLVDATGRIVARIGDRLVAQGGSSSGGQLPRCSVASKIVSLSEIQDVTASPRPTVGGG